MALEAELAQVSTSYFKLTTGSEVRYSVYNATSSSPEQAVLDAELELRKVHPKALVALYNKELWTFSLVAQEEPPVPDAQFKLTSGGVQSFVPSAGSSTSSGVSGRGIYGAPLGSLVRAIHKLLLLMLAAKDEVIPFGSSGLLPGNELLQLDPQFLGSGDLSLGIFTKKHNFLNLEDVKSLKQPINSNYAIYLAPSAIRVYLANDTVEESTTEVPSNSKTIVETLNSLHNIRLSATECQWIKLIPNLSHLNGLITQVADYLQPVSNSKYLVWPLQLCYVQEARTIESLNSVTEMEDDALSLIDDFASLKASSTTKVPSSLPTNTNTPNQPTETPIADPTVEESANDLPVRKSDNSPSNVDNTPLTPEEWSDLNGELFGEEDEVTDADFNFFDDNSKQLVNESPKTETLNKESIDNQDFQANSQSITDERKSFYDIPLDEITIPTTPPYTDPGAPLPIHSPNNKKKSIFSPLNFNPIIKSSVDNKYSNGGKFFVSKTESPNSDIDSLPSLISRTNADEGDDSDSTESEYEISDQDDLPLSPQDESLNININIEEPKLKKTKLGSVTPEPTFSAGSSAQTGATLTTNGVPNCLPFLLRSIPIQILPDSFYVNCPSVNLGEIDEVLDTLLPLVLNDDGFLVNNILNSFKWNDDCPDSVKRAIAQLFPDMHRLNFAELAKIPHDIKPKSYSQAESPLSSLKNSMIGLNPHSENMDFITSSIPTKVDEEEKSIFNIAEPKVRVKRLSQELSINANALLLWNMMSFEPINEQKTFKILMVTSDKLYEKTAYFLLSISEMYEKSQLGRIEKLNVDGKINDGIIAVDYENFDFDTLNDYAASVDTELSKLTNPQDLLVLFIDFDSNVRSAIKYSRIFNKFRNSILARSKSNTPCKIKFKLIPSCYISNSGTFSVLSINKLTRLSLGMYNSIGDQNRTFTQLSDSLPKKIDFKLTKLSIAGQLQTKEFYLHLAYERSIDKEWFVASWTNQSCYFQKTKAWYCSSKTKGSLEQVCGEVWKMTLDLLKPYSGKNYLVLTRLNGMISDEELLQWKKLSSQTRELSLIVVSANLDPKLSLRMSDPQYPLNKLFCQDESLNNGFNINKVDSINTVCSSTGMTPTVFTPQTVNSPDLFTIPTKQMNHDSPTDSRTNGQDDSSIIVDISDSIYGLILSDAVPLANSPTKISLKTGYLVKPLANSKNKLSVLEVNLLSCTGNFKQETLLRELLVQYRNLARLGELYGIVDSNDSLVPLHIASVKKCSNFLINLRVE